MSPADELQRRAICLLSESHRLLKAAQRAGQPERARLALQAEVMATKAREAVDKFYAAKAPA
jgi:hypothetical protein